MAKQYIENIDIPDRLRAIDVEKVNQIAESMKAVGLLNPITVHYPDESTCILIAGAHRLEGAKLLGWESIEVSELQCDTLTAQLAEIDENLCRSELTPTQEAEHLAKRKKVWEAIEATKLEVAQVAPLQVQPAKAKGSHGGPRPHDEGFAASTSAATGKDKSTINRAIRRASEVCQEARDLIRGTDLDSGSYLDRLAKEGFDAANQVKRVRNDLDMLRDKERREQLAEEARARNEIAKQDREDSRNELCAFLFGKLGAKEWGYAIDLIERAGGAIKADDLRKWEQPPARIAA